MRLARGASPTNCPFWQGGRSATTGRGPGFAITSGVCGRHASQRSFSAPKKHPVCHRICGGIRDAIAVRQCFSGFSGLHNWPYNLTKCVKKSTFRQIMPYNLTKYCDFVMISSHYEAKIMAGRKNEIRALLQAKASRRSEFIAVYGRRRVGKTFLVRFCLPAY